MQSAISSWGDTNGLSPGTPATPTLSERGQPSPRNPLDEIQSPRDKSTKSWNKNASMSPPAAMARADSRLQLSEMRPPSVLLLDESEHANALMRGDSPQPFRAQPFPQRSPPAKLRAASQKSAKRKEDQLSPQSPYSGGAPSPNRAGNIFFQGNAIFSPPMRVLSVSPTKFHAVQVRSSRSQLSNRDVVPSSPKQNATAKRQSTATRPATAPRAQRFSSKFPPRTREKNSLLRQREAELEEKAHIEPVTLEPEPKVKKIEAVKGKSTDNLLPKEEFDIDDFIRDQEMSVSHEESHVLTHNQDDKKVQAPKRSAKRKRPQSAMTRTPKPFISRATKDPRTVQSARGHNSHPPSGTHKPLHIVTFGSPGLAQYQSTDFPTSPSTPKSTPKKKPSKKPQELIPSPTSPRWNIQRANDSFRNVDWLDSNIEQLKKMADEYIFDSLDAYHTDIQMFSREQVHSELDSIAQQAQYQILPDDDIVKQKAAFMFLELISGFAPKAQVAKTINQRWKTAMTEWESEMHSQSENDRSKITSRSKRRPHSARVPSTTSSAIGGSQRPTTANRPQSARPTTSQSGAGGGSTSPNTLQQVLFSNARTERSIPNPKRQPGIPTYEQIASTLQIPVSARLRPRPTTQGRLRGMPTPGVAPTKPLGEAPLMAIRSIYASIDDRLFHQQNTGSLRVQQPPVDEEKVSIKNLLRQYTSTRSHQPTTVEHAMGEMQLRRKSTQHESLFLRSKAKKKEMAKISRR